MTEWNKIKWCNLLGYVTALDSLLLSEGYRIMKMNELDMVSRLQDEGLTPDECSKKLIYKRNMIK